MRLEITGNDTGHTLIKINGVEVTTGVTEFHLKQEAGYIPELTLKICVPEELVVDLPEGVVIAELSKPE